MVWIEPSKVQRTVIPERFNALPKIKFRTYRKYRPEYVTPDPLLDLCGAIVDVKPLPYCWDWSPNDVADYIKRVGLPDYQDAFIRNDINGRTLCLLESEKCPKLNITNLDHMKKLIASIRELYNIDEDDLKRCIDLPFRRPGTLYIWYKGSRTGPASYFMRITPFLRKINVIRDETTVDRRYYALLNHWNRIPPFKEWCPHVLVGLIPRINPMTGTKRRQVLHPKETPHLLRDLSIYLLPCEIGLI